MFSWSHSIVYAKKGSNCVIFQFNPSSPLKEGDEGYNPCPTLQDRVHVLVSVFPADDAVLITDAMMKKMRKIRRAASDMGETQCGVHFRFPFYQRKCDHS